MLIMGDLNCKVGDAIDGNSGEVSKGGRWKDAEEIQAEDGQCRKLL